MTQQKRLRYLVEGLVAEYNEKHNEHLEIPESEEEQFILYRSLCNIRPAGGMPLEWMKIESEYLNILVHEKGIVTINDMEERETQIYLWQGDITRLSVDAVVNAANNQLLGCFAPNTVGPIINEKVTAKERNELVSCYRSCLQLANAYNLHSIAFCCISTGEFRFPNEEAAQIAIDTVRTYLKETNSKIQVVFNVFKDIDYDIYNKLLG
ncbi:MAG: macro domain-containing protein [Veillonella sp.]|uniref:macro domain-containing protein n=1 Tax=Veillonella sp. TaxID=1926307 RepID=UPI00290E3F64|nr:macro domain-containing protein [Veillonella sp.]MDU6787691.1 macro domain-containing protein [Veillonella sp.]